MIIPWAGVFVLAAALACQTLALVDAWQHRRHEGWAFLWGVTLPLTLFWWTCLLLRDTELISRATYTSLTQPLAPVAFLIWVTAPSIVYRRRSRWLQHRAVVATAVAESIVSADDDQPVPPIR